ncbi:PspA/IM30 family protein [Paratractidigestivibacter sp.]|uniref:PspA/IM30 family protein n=1 Tax=Paratractidigestivibacter sp. TaxID=2847316 RepID=UPI002ABE83B0|nr:PspA/IM30 family protein [Paratractidigestivibacter sp.]
MSILNRFATIIKANINELLDRAEDPAKMVDQYLIDLGDNLAKVKQETAGVMAEEKRCQRFVDDNKAEAARMEDLAKKALYAGNEGDARTFLAKKQQLEAKGEELQKAADAAKANADKMRQMHDKLVSDIEQLKARKESIKAKSAVAKTQNMVNEMTSGTDRAAGAIDAFNRMEAKVDKQLDTADSMAELNSAPADSAEALEAKYAGNTDAAVDDELAKLKAEMGL